MKCFKCDYGWQPRVATPKACPRCKTRFDFMWGVKNGS
jgi:predicted Zn-ribbon and HTH transcriptional regulator